MKEKKASFEIALKWAGMIICCCGVWKCCNKARKLIGMCSNQAGNCDDDSNSGATVATFNTRNEKKNRFNYQLYDRLVVYSF